MGFFNQWTNKGYHHSNLVGKRVFFMLSTYNHRKYNPKMSYCELYAMEFLPNSMLKNNIWK